MHQSILQKIQQNFDHDDVHNDDSLAQLARTSSNDIVTKVSVALMVLHLKSSTVVM